MVGIINHQTDSVKSQAVWDAGRLRNLNANSSDPDAIREAAQEFSSLMFKMVIKTMRQAQESFKSSMFSSATSEHWQDMMDDQWALHIAKTKDNGIVDTVFQQFSKNATDKNSDCAVDRSKKTNPTALMPGRNHFQFANAVKILPTSSSTSALTNSSMTQRVSSEGKIASSTFKGREDFIEKLLPSAIAAAKTIGVDPKLLLAQAALETGWGAKIAKLPDGNCSHNLFGIKASGNWNGPKVTTRTTEYADGVLQRKSDQFRAYGNFVESMQDYVQLIGSSTRYHLSRDKVQSPQLYTQALQDAGYATDPNYAEKILSIYKDL